MIKVSIFIVLSFLLAGKLFAQTNPTTQPFKHPGALHTLEDLDRMKARVAAGEHPWIDGWNRLIEDKKAQNNYRPAPSDHMASRQRAQDDATSAYLNTLRWYITGDTSFADCAVRNLNAWSSTVSKLPSGPDQPGLSGIPIGTFAMTAELLRIYPGWRVEDQEKFKQMLLTYWYPVCHDFLTRHNGAAIDNYWANWDACNVVAIMSIGIFCDDCAKFDEAVEYFKNGAGCGSIKNAVYFLHPDNLGQWQEAGRDHAHALGGMGLLAEACQVALNQGIDLYAYDNNRLLAGAEYEAQYNLWIGVPYKYYNNHSNANQMYISTNYHGRLGNCEVYDMLYNHYVIKKGLKAPMVQKFAELIRPEGGNADLIGYGTLTFTLDANRSPYPPAPVPPAPMDVAAIPGLDRVDLKWSPSGAYTAHGYKVLRSTQPNGQFETIFTTTNNTSPTFTDIKVTADTTYYYKIQALNQSGTSEASKVVLAKTTTGGKLLDHWIEANIASDAAGTSRYSPDSSNTIEFTGLGDDIGDTQDSARFIHQKVTGDFTITARLIDRAGPISKTGIMMRSSADPSSAMSAITLGEVGGRQCRFATRENSGGKRSTKLGNDYTWQPIWMRLQRIGDEVTAYQSPDGVNWYSLGTSKVNLTSDYLVGLFLCTGKDKKDPGKSTFDHIILEVKPPAVPESPKDFTLKSDEKNNTLRWTRAKDQTGISIECSIDRSEFHEIATLDGAAEYFINTGVSNKEYSYRIRAYNTGGYSEYSPAKSVTRAEGR